MSFFPTSFKAPTSSTTLALNEKLAQWVAAADYGVIGDGTTDDTAAYMAADAHAASVGKTVLAIGKTGNIIRFAANHTLAAPVDFSAGGQFKPDTAITISCNSGVIAPTSSQIFSGLGTVTVAKNIVVPVEWYGAKGDGVFDNTTVVQNAINGYQTAVQGVNLYFGESVYYFTGSLTIASNSIRLIGQGRESSILNFNNGSSNCISVGSVYTTVYRDVMIANLSIKGVSKTGGYAVAFNSAQNCTADNLFIDNMPGGIFAQFINNVTVSNSVILLENASGYTAAVTWYSVASAAQTSNVLIILNTTINTYLNAAGIYVDGACNTLRMQTCGIIHCTYGMRFRNTQASNTYFPEFIYCDDVEIDGVVNQCVSIEGGRNYHFSNCDFFNNHGGTPTDTNTINILADDAGSITGSVWFTSCRIGGAQQSGMYIEAKDVYITSCYVGDNSIAGIAAYPGIALGNNGNAGGAASGILITGGLGGNAFGDLYYQSYGVTVAAGCTQVTITGVNFAVCRTGAILDNTSSPVNVRWTGCTNIDGTLLPDRMAVVSSDPANLVEGELWLNDPQVAVKAYIGGGIQQLNNSMIYNRIINGDMLITQRGNFFSLPANGTYVADRWFLNWTGAAPASVLTANGLMQIQANGLGGNTLTSVSQRIESLNTYDLPGKTISISVNLYSSVTTTWNWALTAPTNPDNWTSSVPIASGSWTSNTTGQVYSATVTLPSLEVQNGLQLSLSPGGSSGFNSGSVQITNVQLALGAAPMPYEHRLYGTELNLCQRYYETSYPVGTNPGTAYTSGGTGAGDPMIWGSSSISNGWADIGFQIVKRVVPTITLYQSNGTTGVVDYFTSSWLTGYAPSTVSPKQKGLLVGFSGVSDIQFHWTADAEI